MIYLDGLLLALSALPQKSGGEFEQLECLASGAQAVICDPVRLLQRRSAPAPPSGERRNFYRIKNGGPALGGLKKTRPPLQQAKRQHESVSAKCSSMDGLTDGSASCFLKTIQKAF